MNKCMSHVIVEVRVEKLKMNTYVSDRIVKVSVDEVKMNTCMSHGIVKVRVEKLKMNTYVPDRIVIKLVWTSSK